MPLSIQKLVDQLVQDPWRREQGFSPEIENCHRQLTKCKTDFDTVGVIREWVRSYQPCLFGRIAAAESDLLSFCIISDDDIDRGDRCVADKIQDHRTQWKRNAFLGSKSGFIIAVVTPRVAFSLPGRALLSLSRRICQHYLLKSIRANEVYLDHINYEISIDPPEYRQWEVGVNYFSSSGDLRWWHDHRFPGGFAFSMNSVGHMAFTGSKYNLISELEKQANTPKSKRRRIDSLGIALQYAMMTINRAQSTVSGKATWLKNLTPTNFKKVSKTCPIPAKYLPKELLLKDHRAYYGWYHTDHTLPSRYFTDEIPRPVKTKRLLLDLKYLFDEHLNNPAHQTMGKGIRIR